MLLNRERQIYILTGEREGERERERYSSICCTLVQEHKGDTHDVASLILIIIVDSLEISRYKFYPLKGILQIFKTMKMCLLNCDLDL